MSKRQNLESKKDNTGKILKVLMRYGFIGDKNLDNDKVREAQKRKRQNAYHNTELLLKHYRNIAWMIECFPETVSEELNRSFDDVDTMIKRLDFEISIGNRTIENRLESMYKSRRLLDSVNEALTVLQKKPEDGERLYKLIYLTYISPETLTHNQIVYRLDISSRQYYRLREQAINILSIRLWSAPNKDIEFWHELISLMGDDK